ncbi:ribosome assembly factor SBDS [Candidatus Woesearchaeota archaeon]|nr:ribosome assembly factor SBDS [Candidatus Woesearchaeota archaeon]
MRSANLPKPITMDQERISVSLAKIKKGGEHFEIVVDSDLAVAYKQGKDVDLHDLLKSQRIFTHATQGIFAADMRLQAVFNTTDALTIAKLILAEGEIQLTAEYRAKLVEDKRKRIVQMIHVHCIDPKNHLPHPPQRIENAMEEAKVRIDEFKIPEQQWEEIIKKLRPIIPLRVETAQLQVHLPTTYAAKLHGLAKSFGKISKEMWLSDGSWTGTLEIPAGLKAEIMEKLNAATHGSVEIETLKQTS